MQQQKNYDGAVNTYTQVTQRTAAEVGAKAQLQIGLCRLEQQRFNEAATALLVVPFTYDYPELSASKDVATFVRKMRKGGDVRLKKQD